jgi:hypothetical protein
MCAFPKATALRQLLKRIRVDIESVDIAVQDSLDLGEAEPLSPRCALQPLPRIVRAATFGLVVKVVTTEAAAGTVATGATAKSSAGDWGSSERKVLVEFGGFYWVPQVVARSQQCAADVVYAAEETQQWLVTFPFSAQACPSCCSLPLLKLFCAAWLNDVALCDQPEAKRVLMMQQLELLESWWASCSQQGSCHQQPSETAVQV